MYIKQSSKVLYVGRYLTYSETTKAKQYQRRYLFKSLVPQAVNAIYMQ